MHASVVAICLVCLSGAVNSGSRSEKETAEATVALFKSQMSVFNSFDFFYNKVQQHLEPQREDTTIGEERVRYIVSTYDYLRSPQSWETKESYRYWYLYFTNPSVKLSMVKEDEYGDPKSGVMIKADAMARAEAFAKAYIAYSAFWITLMFRVGSLYLGSYYFSGPLYEPREAARIRWCEELYTYLHCFTSMEYETTILKFSETRRTCNRKLSKKTWLSWFWPGLGSGSVVSAVEQVANEMSTLDLDFIMDVGYFRCKNRRDYRTNGVIEWRKVPAINLRDKTSKKKVRTLFRDYKSLRVDGSGNTEQMQRTNTYNSIWTKILKVLDEKRSLTIENFFGRVLVGKSWKMKKSLKELIPDYGSCLELWKGTNLSKLAEIRKLDPTKMRQMHEGKGDLLFRNNAVEIIRKVTSIMTKDKLTSGRLLKYLPNLDISALEEQPNFELVDTDPKSSIDYVLVIPN